MGGPDRLPVKMAVPVERLVGEEEETAASIWAETLNGGGVEGSQETLVFSRADYAQADVHGIHPILQPFRRIEILEVQSRGLPLDFLHLAADKLDGAVLYSDLEFHTAVETRSEHLRHGFSQRLQKLTKFLRIRWGEGTFIKETS